MNAALKADANRASRRDVAQRRPINRPDRAKFLISHIVLRNNQAFPAMDAFSSTLIKNDFVISINFKQVLLKTVPKRSNYSAIVPLTITITIIIIIIIIGYAFLQVNCGTYILSADEQQAALRSPKQYVLKLNKHPHNQNKKTSVSNY